MIRIYTYTAFISAFILSGCGLYIGTTPPAPQNATQQTASSPAQAPTQQTYTPSSSVTHDYQSDIDQDVALIKGRIGAQYVAVNSQPDAKVSDGYGHMLYAWVIEMQGSMTQQIYFFIDNRFLGTDTSKMHGPTTVSPEGTGSIIASYAHYLPGDPDSSPSGKPYTVTFHWNGSQLIPSDTQILNDINQTRN